MTALYDRRFSLTISAKDGHGLDFSEFKVTFNVRQWELSTPNQADIRIINPAKTTAEKMVKEFDRVVIQAGYPGIFGTIFDGTIVQSRYGRINPTDTYLDITAADGDMAHTFAVVNTTLAAGARPADVHAALCTAMAPHGVTQGYTAPMEGPALPRGRVLWGLARERMTELAEATGTVWNIRNGQVQVVSRAGYLPDEAVVLTAATGLIGMPQQTPDGIMVRCLLNPLLKVNGRIKLDNGSIQQARLPVMHPNADGSAVQSTAAGFMPKTDNDGFYRILSVDHEGDTRGTPWYSDLACIAVSGSSPNSQAQRGRGGTTAPGAPAA